MLPAPIVLPKDQFPVCALIVVRLLEDPPLPETAASDCDLPPPGVCTAAVTPLAAAVPVGDKYEELFRE